MNVQTIKTPTGENLVVLTEQDFQDLVDARDHAMALRAVADGADTLSEAETIEYLAAQTPLAFWRKHRGLTQTALAANVGRSQPYLAQIETGKRVGDVVLYAKLAAALRLTIEDLVPTGD